MDIEKPLSAIMSDTDIADTHEKLLKIGVDGSKPREIASDFMKLGSAVNAFRFHKQENMLDYCASAEQFLYQLKAVKDTHGFTNDRISAGMIWLKDCGFDYTFGGLNIGLTGKDAFEVLNKRAEYWKIEKAKTKAQTDTEKGGGRKESYTSALYSE